MLSWCLKKPRPAKPRASERRRPALPLLGQIPVGVEGSMERPRAALLRRPAQRARLSFTLTSGRTHFSDRVCVLAGSLEDLEGALALDPAADLADAENRTGRRLAFLFSGQGSQYAGMGKALYRLIPCFAPLSIAAPSARRFCPALLEALFGEGDAGSLIHETAFTQPALFVVQAALTDLLRSWGVAPDAESATASGSLPPPIAPVSTARRLPEPGGGSRKAHAGPAAPRRDGRDLRRRSGRGQGDRALRQEAHRHRGRERAAKHRDLRRSRPRRRDRRGLHEIRRSGFATHSLACVSLASDRAGDGRPLPPGRVAFRERAESRLDLHRDRRSARRPGRWAILARSWAEPGPGRRRRQGALRIRRHRFLELGPGGALIALGRQCTEGGAQIWLGSSTVGAATGPHCSPASANSIAGATRSTGTASSALPRKLDLAPDLSVRAPALLA